MLRLFIAIATPTSALPSLAKARDLLRESGADVKWEPTEKLHCTIKFLGDTREELVQPIVGQLSQIAGSTPPFSVCYKGVSCFPGRRDPRTIWAGIEDSEGAMKKLFEAVDEAMSSLGFEREGRAFHAHVTLGRVKGTRHIRELLDTMETVTLENPPVKIQEIDLVKSTLQPGGSRYALVAAMKLGMGTLSAGGSGV